MDRQAKLRVVKATSPQEEMQEAIESFLRRGGDAFSLQRLLGHSDLAMTRRYAELAQADVVAKHWTASPGDKFLGVVQKAGGRKRMW